MVVKISKWKDARLPVTFLRPPPRAGHIKRSKDSHEFVIKEIKTSQHCVVAFLLCADSTCNLMQLTCSYEGNARALTPCWTRAGQWTERTSAVFGARRALLVGFVLLLLVWARLRRSRSLLHSWSGQRSLFEQLPLSEQSRIHPGRQKPQRCQRVTQNNQNK